MVVTDKSVRVESNLGQAQAFTIATSAKAFSILSDRMYRDKIGAVVREITCNAIDAHVEANSNKKVQVHLPTNSESFFSVKDFGVGLSQENIFKLYTSYFSSTKTGSNDLIGGLGLGSKSPFAYTDQFTVRSTYNGEIKTYLAVIGSEGFPTITLVSSILTQDHNGVEIIIPTKKEDEGKWLKSASQQLYWVNDLIEFNIGVDFSLKVDDEFTIPGSFWFMKSIDNSANNFITSADQLGPSEFFIKMGPVVYPLNPNHLNHEYNTEWYQVYRSISYGQAIVFDVPIGSVNIAPSREELSYDPSTIRVLNKFLVEKVAEFKNKLIEKIEASSNSSYIRGKAAYKTDRIFGTKLSADFKEIFFEEVGVIQLNIDPRGKSSLSVSSQKLGQLVLSPLREIKLFSFGEDSYKASAIQEVKKYLKNNDMIHTNLTVLISNKFSSKLMDFIGNSEVIQLIIPKREKSNEIKKERKISFEKMIGIDAGHLLSYDDLSKKAVSFWIPASDSRAWLKNRERHISHLVNAFPDLTIVRVPSYDVKHLPANVKKIEFFSNWISSELSAKKQDSIDQQWIYSMTREDHSYASYIFNSLVNAGKLPKNESYKSKMANSTIKSTDSFTYLIQAGYAKTAGSANNHLEDEFKSVISSIPALKMIYDISKNYYFSITEEHKKIISDLIK